MKYIFDKILISWSTMLRLTSFPFQKGGQLGLSIPKSFNQNQEFVSKLARPTHI